MGRDTLLPPSFFFRSEGWQEHEANCYLRRGEEIHMRASVLRSCFKNNRSVWRAQLAACRGSTTVVPRMQTAPYPVNIRNIRQRDADLGTIPQNKPLLTWKNEIAEVLKQDVHV